MKKHGFTIAELLVALGIIAIGAAIMAPIYLNARPDQYKFRVISNYNLLNNATERVLENPAIYYKGDVGTTLADCKGLTCTQSPDTTSGFTNAERVLMTGKCKYPLLMKELLRIGDSTTTCSTSDGKLIGRTHDSVQWAFVGDTSSGYTVTLTFNRPFGASTDCSYNSSSCRNPNVFNFRVDPSGDITNASGDNLTKAYLRNMTNIHKSDEIVQ